MKIRTLALLAVVAFVLGALMPAAYAARKETTYKKVAGGSSSCTMVKASVNNENEKAGGRTQNFAGCSSSNPTKTLGTNRLKVEPYIIDQFGETCSYYNPFLNGGNETYVLGTAAIQKASCQSNLSNISYSGYAIGGRKTDSGTWEYESIQSGWLVFN